VTNFFAFVVCFRHISLWDDAFVLSRESNKIINRRWPREKDTRTYVCTYNVVVFDLPSPGSWRTAKIGTTQPLYFRGIMRRRSINNIYVIFVCDNCPYVHRPRILKNPPTQMSISPEALRNRKPPELNAAPPSCCSAPDCNQETQETHRRLRRRDFFLDLFRRHPTRPL
jgi:hypothetical protein